MKKSRSDVILPKNNKKLAIEAMQIVFDYFQVRRKNVNLLWKDEYPLVSTSRIMLEQMSGEEEVHNRLRVKKKSDEQDVHIRRSTPMCSDAARYCLGTFDLKTKKYAEFINKEPIVKTLKNPCRIALSRLSNHRALRKRLAEYILFVKSKLIVVLLWAYVLFEKWTHQKTAVIKGLTVRLLQIGYIQKRSSYLFYSVAYT